MLPVQRALRWRPLSFKWPMGLSSPPGAKGVRSFLFDRFWVAIPGRGNGLSTPPPPTPVKNPNVPPAPAPPYPPPRFRALARLGSADGWLAGPLTEVDLPCRRSEWH